ncbi:hypothetical protein FISHEDRAFT_70246 [Fistulina hepatica ATCC 64428]|uniref:Exonuclease V n=1 Tax=Fistulina hepatica ATCC 64428 TaxID=1128425 RepID=A0A0D7AK89_9AGAR|nr:hypothetical protein FISHEDRAFT_70246 [Fistulina hepatica ATCC 64428]
MAHTNEAIPDTATAVHKSARSSGDFSEFNDFAEFTEADFAMVDTSCQQIETSDLSQRSGETSYSMYNDFESLTESDFERLEAAAGTSNGKVPDIEDTVVESPSPLQRFRCRRPLAVTDISALAWCEYQFNYGLNQGRHLPLDKRPMKFLSNQGKSISAAPKAVHKKLEKELNLQKVYVQAHTEEERWALRMLNMIASLRCLLTDGYAVSTVDDFVFLRFDISQQREIPVFGLVHGETVVGVIDEISKRPIEAICPEEDDESNSSSPGKRRRGTPTDPSKRVKRTPSSPDSNSYETATTMTKSESDSVVHIIDTKSRRVPNLPRKEDRIPSRLQVMIYYRLLSALLSSSPAFDFLAFWERLSLDPQALFTKKFSQQATMLAQATVPMKRLSDLVPVWYDLLPQLSIAEVDKALLIIYRLVDDKPRPRKKKRGTLAAAEKYELAVRQQEERDMARAIEASLRDAVPENTILMNASSSQDDMTAALDAAAKLVDGENASDLQSSPLRIEATDADGANSDEDDMGAILDAAMDLLNEPVASQETAESMPVDTLAEQPPVAGPSKLTNESAATDAGAASVSDNEAESLGEDAQIKILGIYAVHMDDELLDAYLDSAMAWWRGQRRPVGVPPGLARRCDSCEYREDCEWREAKAAEWADHIAKKHAHGP